MNSHKLGGGEPDSSSCGVRVGKEPFLLDIVKIKNLRSIKNGR